MSIENDKLFTTAGADEFYWFYIFHRWYFYSIEITQSDGFEMVLERIKVWAKPKHRNNINLPMKIWLWFDDRLVLIEEACE